MYAAAAWEPVRAGYAKLLDAVPGPWPGTAYSPNEARVLAEAWQREIVRHPL